jgi:hypothetical protein
MHMNSMTIEKIAILHDGYIEMGTRLILLENIVEHLPRRREPSPPVREIRKDASSYREEAAKRKAELIAYAAKARAMQGKAS